VIGYYGLPPNGDRAVTPAAVDTRSSSDRSPILRHRFARLPRDRNNGNGNGTGWRATQNETANPYVIEIAL
jgi:hypothetical protein